MRTSSGGDVEIFKKPLLLLFLPILVSCTASISPDISGEKKNSEDIHGERDILFAVTIEEEEDPGLALYRNPTTRLDVLDFYSNTIGNERIATAILHQAEKNNIPLNSGLCTRMGGKQLQSLGLQ